MIPTLSREETMRHDILKRLILASLCAVAVLGLSALPAGAQSNRTWVSTVGSDSNPCTRTAPCLTFATALTNTNPGGEINVLDSGNFRPVIINKSITIQAVGVEAGVATSAGGGICIGARAADRVN